MKRGIAKLRDMSFPHRKTGTLCARYYLMLPAEVVNDENFPLQFSKLKEKGKVLVSIENGKLVAEPLG